MIVEKRPEYIVHLGKKYKNCGSGYHTFQMIHFTVYYRPINNVFEKICVDYFTKKLVDHYISLRRRGVRSKEGIEIKYY